MVVHVLNPGTLSYATALQLQQTLMRLRQVGRIGNTLLLLEHPPVITLGRNARVGNVVASPGLLAQKGVELFEINRGGDVTFHGPGQLVAYPIFDLRSFDPKIGAVEFVRRLEEVLIRTCSDSGIPTLRIPGMTGVWTVPRAGKAAAKIAAIGVHISRGVTTHGFALNVSTDLDFFSLIVPCGLTGKAVTSIAKEQGRSVAVDDFVNSVSRNFGRVFQSQMLWLESLEDLMGEADQAQTRPQPGNQDTPACLPYELRQLHRDDSELA